mmetsp:Transcript_26034/g.56225  ORF Transcript_26034/g.56225 Transcript_26034/m.56225 type:complete len:130 (-) Transcript_26034:348-737(-)
MSFASMALGRTPLPPATPPPRPAAGAMSETETEEENDTFDAFHQRLRDGDMPAVQQQEQSHARATNTSPLSAPAAADLIDAAMAAAAAASTAMAAKSANATRARAIPSWKDNNVGALLRSVGFTGLSEC